MAICHAMMGESGLARVSLRSALRLSPRDPNVLFNAARVESQLGNTHAALDWLRKSLAAGIAPAKVRSEPIFDKFLGNPEFQKQFGQANQILNREKEAAMPGTTKRNHRVVAVKIIPGNPPAVDLPT